MSALNGVWSAGQGNAFASAKINTRASQTLPKGTLNRPRRSLQLFSTRQSFPGRSTKNRRVRTTAPSAAPRGLAAVEPGESEEEEEEEVVDFTQGGWLWTNDAAAKTKAKLNAQKLRPKKSLGQNFVTDDDVLARVARAANIRPGDRVLEIGPGTGNLTRHLIAAGAQVTAVEKDHRLVDQLQEEFGEVPGFRLIHKDVLQLNAEETIAELLGDDVQEGQKVKVVANLPYYITTDILKKLLPLGGSLSNLIFMLQEEVAQRFANHPPGHRDYRYMSVYCRYFSNPVYKFRISRHVYHPVPKVDGAVVDFALIPPEERVDVGESTTKQFLGTVHAAFLHRRKMMKNSMPVASEVVSQALESAELNISARAQDLSLEDFVRVHRLLEEHRAAAEANGDTEEEEEEET